MSTIAAAIRPMLLAPAVRWLALLALCAAYIQGGLQKALDFPAALAEMRHFGLEPAAPLVIATVVLELGAAAMILAGRGRAIGALALAGFTVMATLVANRFWEMAGIERFMAANAFFEHLGLAGAFVLVAVTDMAARR